MTLAVFEFNIPGLPQVHIRARLIGSEGPEKLEVTLRNDDRPWHEAVLASAVAPVSDCYFDTDANQRRSRVLQVGSSAFQIPIAEADAIMRRFRIPEAVND